MDLQGQVSIDNFVNLAGAFGAAVGGVFASSTPSASPSEPGF